MIERLFWLILAAAFALRLTVRTISAMMLAMRRTNIHLTDAQRDRLRDESISTGLRPAELVRRAIDLIYPPRDDRRDPRSVTRERGDRKGR